MSLQYMFSSLKAGQSKPHLEVLPFQPTSSAPNLCYFSSLKIMASLLFREFKGSNISCSSPASAAVCTSIDRRSVVRPVSGRSIDRHTPHLRDSWRSSSLKHLSQETTKPYNQKSRKSTGTQLDLVSSSSGSSRRRRSGEKQPELLSPGNSSRYLLNDADDAAIFDAFPDPKPVFALPTVEKDESAVILKPSSPALAQDQVVVLRVSLHCKGCEGKVRRHISKMEGVKSFTIDMATKKVVVIGKVTPLGVLNSVSKVKNAEFWSWPSRSSVSFSAH